MDMFDPAVVEPPSTSSPLWSVAPARRSWAHRPHRPAAEPPGVAVHGTTRRRRSRRCGAKPGADQIGITIGDYATATVGATFRLAFAVFNAITNLTTQAEQVDCFRNVADHLEPGGCFVAETPSPPCSGSPGETYRAFEVTPTHLGFDEYDVVEQFCRSHHYLVVDGRLEQSTSTHRCRGPPSSTSWPGSPG